MPAADEEQSLHFLRAGYVDTWSNRQRVRDVGAYGLWWSSAVDSIALIRDLRLDTTEVRPSNGSHRAYGFSVRCLVLSN